MLPQCMTSLLYAPRYGHLIGNPFGMGDSLIIEDKFVLNNITLNETGNRLLKGSSYSDSSRYSEAYSGHIIHDLFENYNLNPSLYKTEAEIEYFCSTKKTDYILQLRNNVDTYKIAVEVKRIHDFNNYVIIDDYYINNILDKANLGAIQSNQYVCSFDKWNTQVLHILTTYDIYDKVIQWIDNKEYCGFSCIFITVVDGDQNVIF